MARGKDPEERRQIEARRAHHQSQREAGIAREKQVTARSP
jgi:hypothetical protein